MAAGADVCKGAGEAALVVGAEPDHIADEAVAHIMALVLNEACFDHGAGSPDDVSNAVGQAQHTIGDFGIRVHENGMRARVFQVDPALYLQAAHGRNDFGRRGKRFF